MKILYNTLYVALALSTSTVSASSSVKQKMDAALAKLSFEIPIRVLIQESPLDEVQWQLHSDEGFVVYSPSTKKKTIFTQKTIVVTYKQGAVFLNGQKQADVQLFVIPLTGLIRNGTIGYDGVFALSKVHTSLFLVNHLDIEEYLRSVLPYESVKGWPDEVQKAFCIAFRSYAISKVLEQRALHKNKLHHAYDIKNTNEHQVYRGHEKSDCFKHIVEATRGVVVAYKDKPILAMFDIACGGVIPGFKEGIHFAKAPYLQRKYPCNYCKPHKHYRWEVVYTVAEVEAALKKIVPTLGKIRDIQVATYDEAGIAKTIRIRSGYRRFEITAGQFRSQLKNLKSLCFGIEKSGDSIKIVGKGHGHHMGLCQWGAYYLVKKGWDHRKVLQFYYPNTTFMRLQKASHGDV